MRRHATVPEVVTSSAAIGACEKEQQCQQASHLLREMRQRQDIVPEVITHDASISACEKGQQPAGLIPLVSDAAPYTVPEVITHSAAISACEKGQRCQQALRHLRTRQHHAFS